MLYLLDFFKLAGDETRLRIMVLLAQGDLCICQLSGILRLSQPKVSKHLAKLRDMRYVKDRRVDKFVYYSLTIEDEAIRQMIADVVANLDQYPQLKEDAAHLAEKEYHLSRCKVNQGKTDQPSK